MENAHLMGTGDSYRVIKRFEIREVMVIQHCKYTKSHVLKELIVYCMNFTSI